MHSLVELLRENVVAYSKITVGFFTAHHSGLPSCRRIFLQLLVISSICNSLSIPYILRRSNTCMSHRLAPLPSESSLNAPWVDLEPFNNVMFTSLVRSHLQTLVDLDSVRSRASSILLQAPSCSATY